MVCNLDPIMSMQFSVTDLFVGEGMYVNIAARILPGSDVPSSDAEHFLVQDVKSSSPQAAPLFKDPPKVGWFE